MKRVVHLLKVSLLLACLPASAWAVSFSNLELTNTSFSVNISGNLPNETPSSSKNFIFVVNANELANPGFVTGELLTSSTSSFPGFQGVAHLYTGSVYDYLYIDFYSNIPPPRINLDWMQATHWSEPWLVIGQAQLLTRVQSLPLIFIGEQDHRVYPTAEYLSVLHLSPTQGLQRLFLELGLWLSPLLGGDWVKKRFRSPLRDNFFWGQLMNSHPIPFPFRGY